MRKNLYAGIAIVSVIMFAGIGALGEELLTNESVIKLHEAGLPAEVIIAKIEASQTDFDTTVDTLIALSARGLPKEVITAMTESGAEEPQGAPSTVVVQQGASLAPNVASQFAGTPCPSPGIFVESPGQDPQEIDPTTYTQAKTGGRFLSSLTYGIKSVKSKAVIQGTGSRITLPGRDSNFLFCFEETETGLSYESKGATNPSEFLLVQLTINQKAGNREFVVGKLNAWVGAQSGAPPKVVRQTTYEKVAPGVFRVTPASPLAVGE